MRHKFQSHAYSFFSETYWKKFGEDGGRNKKKKSTRIRLDFFFYVHVCSVVSDSLQPNADSSAYGISQAKILEWVTMPSSRGIANTQIETTSPACQADSSPLSHLGSSFLF